MGSGEFHLYRQMRRKEANRQAIMGYRKMRDDLNSAYHQKLEENEKASEEKTAKKREKRQKKKANKKNKKSKQEQKKESESEESDPDTDDEDSKDKPKEKVEEPVKIVKPTSKVDDPLMQHPPKKAPIVIQF